MPGLDIMCADVKLREPLDMFSSMGACCFSCMHALMARGIRIDGEMQLLVRCCLVRLHAQQLMKLKKACNLQDAWSYFQVD